MSIGVEERHDMPVWLSACLLSVAFADPATEEIFLEDGD